MFASTDHRVMLGSRSELSRVPCAGCQHAEFIHGDHNDRLCLYSECGCSGFAVDVAA
jgi:hypothetical protein